MEDQLQLARPGSSTTEFEAVDLVADLRDTWQGVETADADLGLETDAIITAHRSRLQQLLENLVAMQSNTVAKVSPSPSAISSGASTSQTTERASSPRCGRR